MWAPFPTIPFRGVYGAFSFRGEGEATWASRCWFGAGKAPTVSVKRRRAHAGREAQPGVDNEAPGEQRPSPGCVGLTWGWGGGLLLTRALAKSHFGASHLAPRGIPSRGMPHWPSTNPQHGRSLAPPGFLLSAPSLPEVEVAGWCIFIPGPSCYQLWLCSIRFRDSVVATEDPPQSQAVSLQKEARPPSDKKPTSRHCW